MGNAPSFNTALYGGLDYNSLLNNPYLYYAMMSPNVNFKGSSGEAAKTDGVSNTAETNNTSNEAISQALQSQETAGGPSLGQTVFAVGLLALGTYGIIKGKKNGWLEKAWKTVTGKSKTENVSATVLDRLTAIKNGNGELKVMVPNKTKTFAGNKIQTGVNEYGINSSIDAARQSFNPEISVTRSFKVETPQDKYTVFVKDGKITKVVSALMKKDEDVLARLTNAEAKSTDAEVLERFKKIAEELGKNTEEVDVSVLNGVTDIRYSNKFGDDTLNMVMKEYGKTPQLQSFKTLEQFDRTSEAVKSYIPTASEEVFAGSLVNETGRLFNKKGVLVDGLGVIRCDEEIVAGTRCYFEGDKLVKIVQGENTYTEGSIGFMDFVKANKKAIEQFKKDVFEDRIAKKIPYGAVIGNVK